MQDYKTTLEIVRERLQLGRTISDGEVHDLIRQINQLRAALKSIAEYNYHGQQSMPDIAREALNE